MSLLATLDRLHKLKVAATGHLPVFELKLPFVDIKDELPNSGYQDADLESCKYVLHDADHALRHSYFLLALLVDVSSSAAGSYDVTFFFQGYASWILDGFLLLREIETAWGPSIAAHQPGVETCVLSIRAVHSLLVSLDKLLLKTLKCKGYCVLARLCAELCNYPDVLSDTSIEITFCTCLLDLAAVSEIHEPVAQAVRFQLLPTLHVFQDSQHESGGGSSDTLVGKLPNTGREESHIVQSTNCGTEMHHYSS